MSRGRERESVDLIPLHLTTVASSEIPPSSSGFDPPQDKLDFGDPYVSPALSLITFEVLSLSLPVIAA